MSDIVYADFTCPLSYLASLRVDRLLATGYRVPDWRAVEHRPRLPFIGLQLDTAAQATRNRDLNEVRALLPQAQDLPPTAPTHLPNTASAVAAYAEAYEAGVADLVRPLLFHAYWVEGKDIGDPEVLRRLLPEAFRKGRRTSDPIKDFGYAVTYQHAPITIAAHRRIYRWQQQWLALAASVGLTLTTGFGTVSGHHALTHLTEPASSDRGLLVAPRPVAGVPMEARS